MRVISNMRRDPPSQDSVVKVICICFSRLQSNIHCHTQINSVGGQSGSRAREEQPPTRGPRQGIGFLSFSPFCRWRRQYGHASEGNGTRSYATRFLHRCSNTNACPFAANPPAHERDYVPTRTNTGSYRRTNKYSKLFVS